MIAVSVSRPTNHWLLPFALASATLFFSQRDALPILRFTRSAMEDQEVWRLISGHLVHLGHGHLISNLVAMFGIWLLVGQQFNLQRWLWISIFCLLGIDLGLLYLDPAVHWYAGLSGLLHGYLMAGVTQHILQNPLSSSHEALLISGAVLIKLTYEQFIGSLPSSSEMIGGAVLVNAHLYGAASGTFAALLLWSLGPLLYVPRTPNT
jgi:rhomboid family GlyGly-CTERM serine protease